jgi:ribosomal protein S18 acetylase RimI-like enzyme
VLEERLGVWSELLRSDDERRLTLLALDEGLVAFANSYFEDDPRWGALLDNLHVAPSHARRGVGSALLASTAEAVLARGGGRGLYLWVLEQNAGAQAFYRALGASYAGRAPVTPPGGVAGRLSGSPAKLRYAWPEPRVLLARARASGA